MAVKIKFACACGKSLAADASAAGRKAKCPACGQAVQVPQLPPAASESELGLAPIDDLPSAPSPRSLKSAASQQSPTPPVRPSALPVSAAPPPLPGTAGQAVKSIWDEEEEYRMQAPPEKPCPNCRPAMAAHAGPCPRCRH